MPEAAPPVEREDDGQSGRYVIHLSGAEEAEMTYRRVRPGVIAIDHTFVPPSQRGKGLAERLVEAGIAGARSDGDLIVPICSYVVAQFRRHPDWADLRARDD
jgi:predicted GNAT family acetyltransferase